MDNRPAYASQIRALRRTGSPQLQHVVGHDHGKGRWMYLYRAVYARGQTIKVPSNVAMEPADLLPLNRNPAVDA
jgi:hypothetical protein